MKLIKAGSRPTTRAAESNGSGGIVYHDTVHAGSDGVPVRFTLVTFSPGARTAWHRHAEGQVLYVTHGAGWVQCRGGPVAEMRTGDTVVIPPNTDHWHGAQPDHLFTHMALSSTAGPPTQWLQHTTADEYKLS